MNNSVLLYLGKQKFHFFVWAILETFPTFTNIANYVWHTLYVYV